MRPWTEGQGRRRGRRPGRWVASAALLASIGVWACAAPAPRSAEERLRIGEDAVSRVRVAASVVDRTLAATEAVADFGIEAGVRMVRVRIVDAIKVDLQVETPEAISLAAPPRVCLVGPYSAPDDAGLSDRCWGEPDLGALVAAAITTDGAGHPVLLPGEPVTLSAALRRGDVRCDYPPGEWLLEVGLEPLVDDRPVGRLDLPPVTVEVSPATSGPLPLRLFDTRYCGLASVVYRDQGEPPVLTP